MALVGLAKAVSYYEENICKSEVKADQYLSMRTWLLKVADTVMVVFDGNFKAKSIPFQWCQQVCLSVDDKYMQNILHMINGVYRGIWYKGITY